MPAPAIAIYYRKMNPDATLRDVVVIVRPDEARVVKHGFSSKLGETPVDRSIAALDPQHATEIGLDALLP